MPENPPPRTDADDRDAIARQIHAYCRSMDRMDVELGNAVWHDDGLADYGPAVFQGSGHGFVAFVTRAHAAFIAHSHQVTNVLITLDGDRAASESYVTATLRQARDGRTFQQTVHGRYLDRWSCRDGRWAIDRRVFLHDFDETREVATSPATASSPARRDRSDPSYALLAL
jgi:hypothetical protein